MDLSYDEMVLLLKHEFSIIQSKHLEEILRHFENNYKDARDFIADLYGFSKKSNNHETSTVYNSRQTIPIKITPDLFDQLNELFVTQTDHSTTEALRKELDLQGCIMLPLSQEVAVGLFQNLVEYGRRAMVEDTPELALQLDDQDQEVRPLSEIQDMEQAIQLSREEYRQQLQAKATLNGDDAVKQELINEKKLDFLVKIFPGVDFFKLNQLYELNCFDLSETVKDIEALYNLRLPEGYNFSLYNERLKEMEVEGSTSTDTESDTGVFEGSDLNSTHGDNREQDHFRQLVNSLFGKRAQLHSRMFHLKQKTMHFSSQKQRNVAFIYQNEVQRCKIDLQNITDEVIFQFQNYDHPSNEVDLHGLIMREVSAILPAILDGKQGRLAKRERLNFKIITGIGSSGRGVGAIHRYVRDFITKHKLSFNPDGPGAYIVTLSGKQKHKFK